MWTTTTNHQKFDYQIHLPGFIPSSIQHIACFLFQPRVIRRILIRLVIISWKMSGNNLCCFLHRIPASSSLCHSLRRPLLYPVTFHITISLTSISGTNGRAGEQEWILAYTKWAAPARANNHTIRQAINLSNNPRPKTVQLKHKNQKHSSSTCLPNQTSHMGTRSEIIWLSYHRPP